MIAISYRREDSLPVAGRLYDRLQAEFGRGNVFMDFDSIPYGVDFRDHIKQMIDRSKVLIAMIGPDWIGRRRQRGRRIDDPTDFVRLEIAYALERKLPIIPILVSNTRMPGPEELPKDIEALAFRNALNLDAGIDFHHHAERLVAAINRLLITPPPPVVPVQKPPPNQVVSAQSSLAPPETQLASPLVSATSEVILGPSLLPQKPSPLESTGRRSTPAPANNATAGPIPQRTQPMVLQRAKALAARSATIWQHMRTKASAAMLRVGRSVRSIKRSAARSIQTLIDYLHRHARVLVVSVGYLIALISATAALYWGFHNNTFRHWLFINSNQWRKLPQILRERSKPQPTQSPFAVPQPRENAPSATSTPPATPIPAPPRGVLTVDSNPQGQVFELIGADGNHRTGTTPTTVEDLPVGYAQVIFKREGFIDHSETVWLASNAQPSVSWNFPDDTRARDSTQANQQVAAAASSINPSAQNGRTWQAWIGDFVRKFMSADELQDIDTSLAFYAPNVDYFDNGQQDTGYIRRDVGEYIQRWPVRRDSVDGEVHVSEKAPDREYSANYKLNFYAESAERHEWSRGKAAVDLDITIIDGVPKISRIKQTFIQRQKGKLGAPVNKQMTSKYPYGIQVSGKPGFVRSPYAPSKREIDVRGFPKGAQIKCPFTGKIFIAP